MPQDRGFNNPNINHNHRKTNLIMITIHAEAFKAAGKLLKRLPFARAKLPEFEHLAVYADTDSVTLAAATLDQREPRGPAGLDHSHVGVGLVAGDRVGLQGHVAAGPEERERDLVDRPEADCVGPAKARPGRHQEREHEGRGEGQAQPDSHGCTMRRAQALQRAIEQRISAIGQR